MVSTWMKMWIVDVDVDVDVEEQEVVERCKCEQ